MRFLPASASMPSGQLAFKTFKHMHELSLRFHLERRTGGLSRVIERGVKGIESIVRFTILNTVPTILDSRWSAVIFAFAYGWIYVTIIAATLWLYTWFHRQGERLAHRHPPARMNDKRYRGQHQGDRLAAQTTKPSNNFKQRGDGGSPLRPLDGAHTRPPPPRPGPRSAGSISARG